MTEGTITMAGVWAAAIGLFGLLLRSIGPWRKQISDMEGMLRAELHAEMATMKSERDVERAAHLAELKEYQMQRDTLENKVSRLETILNRQQLRHNAERALDRHRLNNINACFDSLLLLLRSDPGDSARAVKLIEEMRAKQLVAEAEEKAIIRAAEIKADAGEADHDGN